MDPTHLHLLLNHVPTVGFGVGIALFVLGIGIRSNDLKQASLVVLVGVALISIPTYATGNAAQTHLQERGDVSDGSNEGRMTLSLIETHEGAAFLALAFMEVTGALAWVALWKFRRRSRLSTGMTGALLLLSLVTMALMAQAANVAEDFVGHLGMDVARQLEPFFGGAKRQDLGRIAYRLAQIERGVLEVKPLRFNA
mgnify:CR=1 FL=1